MVVTGGGVEDADADDNGGRHHYEDDGEGSGHKDEGGAVEIAGKSKASRLGRRVPENLTRLSKSTLHASQAAIGSCNTDESCDWEIMPCVRQRLLQASRRAATNLGILLGAATSGLTTTSQEN